MLNQFTWTQFFVTAAVALLLYYLLVTLLFYRAEMKASLEKLMDQVLPKVYLTSSAPDLAQTTPLPETAIGSISTEDGPFLTEAAAIQVAPLPDIPPAASPTPAPPSKAMEQEQFPMGTLADFLEELKSLLELVSETQMEKEEFGSLLQLVISRYTRATHGQHQDKVQQFLVEQCQEKLPFDLTHEELQALWPQ